MIQFQYYEQSINAEPDLSFYPFLSFSSRVCKSSMFSFDVRHSRFKWGSASSSSDSLWLSWVWGGTPKTWHAWIHYLQIHRYILSTSCPYFLNCSLTLYRCPCCSVSMTMEKVKGRGVFREWKTFAVVQTGPLPMYVLIDKYKPGYMPGVFLAVVTTMNVPVLFLSCYNCCNLTSLVTWRLPSYVNAQYLRCSSFC